MEHALSDTWRMLSQRPKWEEAPRGLDRLWHHAVGLTGRISRSPGRFLRYADQIMAMEKRFLHIADRALHHQMAPLQQRFRLGRDTAEDCLTAMAMVREVAARAIGLRPYREQIAGALALNAGCIAEMATGEGKTLVAVMPAVLAGWRGRGCHIITANDYLARRDADLTSAIYRQCSLTVGCVSHDMDPTERRRAYHADITYCTNKEVAADFLRDRLSIGHHQGLSSVLLSRICTEGREKITRLVQRGLACAIIDEADSVFIDDAVTPLLISGEAPNQEQIDAYRTAARLAGMLAPATDYRIDSPYREIRLTPTGKQRLEELAQPLGGFWTGRRRREELITQALVANEFFVRDRHYVVKEKKVVIVDKFTGRLMPDRSWRHGIHQAVEAKEGLEITLPRETYARISFQRFFRLYRHLSGMSGTVAEAQTELWDVYRLPVVTIPTHRPCRRIVMPDRVFASTAEKWKAVLADIERVHQTGRPILVGTSGIRECEHLSRLLSAIGLSHRLLNAKRQKTEARVIAEAGKIGQITVATNMAGRGTDIALGAGVSELGGLHVIATERFDARRIDRQLFGRCARQGDPGSAQAFISLEDELLAKHGAKTAAIKWFCPARKNELPSAVWRFLIGALQRRAEQVAYRMRKDVLAADSWLEQHLGFTSNDI